MTTIDAALRRLVWARAGDRCEYCQMLQELDLATFEIDHIVPEKMDGPTEAGNLALACFKCNNHKGPNIAGIDPETGERAYLFNPREDVWMDHLFWRGPVLWGVTPQGRATIQLLQINVDHRIAHRAQLIGEGAFP